MRVTVSKFQFLKHSVCAAALLATVAFTPVAFAGPLRGAPPDMAFTDSSALILAATQGAGAQKFIDNMAGQAIEFLGNPGMSQTAKQQAFEKLLRESFDMDTIGRFALGRYWRTATDSQRKEYTNLFRKMVVQVYSARFSEYDGQKFETRSVRPEGEKDTLVTSFIIPPSGPEVQVDWRVRHKDGRYRIVDVIVEGVSMSVTQRSDFAAVIQRGGGDVGVLLNHLRNKG
jgi:phospholipid transport system substrate-binding protein